MNAQLGATQHGAVQRPQRWPCAPRAKAMTATACSYDNAAHTAWRRAVLMASVWCPAHLRPRRDACHHDGVMMACSSRVTAFRGARVGGPSKGVSAGGATGAVMMKKDIHPEWHAEAPVICNGVEVMRVGGTKPQYNVDIYSGNHPFYNGVRTMMVMDDGQLNKCVPGPDSHGSMRPVDL